MGGSRWSVEDFDQDSITNSVSYGYSVDESGDSFLLEQGNRRSEKHNRRMHFKELALWGTVIWLVTCTMLAELILLPTNPNFMWVPPLILSGLIGIVRAVGGRFQSFIGWLCSAGLMTMVLVYFVVMAWL